MKANHLLRWFLRLPEHPGKQRIIRNWIGKVLPADGIALEVDGGITLLLHPSDWIEYLLMTTGVYEPQTINFIKSNLSAGQHAVMAGVNFGLHLIVAAKSIGETGSVVGIDPQPKSVHRALRNLEINQVGPQVKIATLALDQSSGLVLFDLPPKENSGAASLLGGGQKNLIGGSIRVDDLIAKCNLLPIRLFLLDVEGYEMNVLRGMGDVRPEIMVVEFGEANQARSGHTCRQLSIELKSLGYRLCDLHGNPLEEPDIAVIESNVVAFLPTVAPIWAI